MSSQFSELLVSVPSTPPLSVSTPPQRTNSLVVTGLPSVFFHPVVLQALRSYFATFGEIYAWAPIRAFARVILVFYSENDAEKAKLSADGLTVEATSASPKTTIRVYRADPTPIHTLSASGSDSPTSRPEFSPYHLRPPALEKNFLISPPGSPPVGWAPVREEPPNNTPLAQDLIIALRQLQFNRERRNSNGSGRSSPSLSVLIEPDEGPGVGVYVEDCSDHEENEDDDDSSDEGEGWFYGAPRPNAKFVPMPTMRPPMSTVV